MNKFNGEGECSLIVAAAAAAALGLDPEPCTHSSQTLNVQSDIELARTNSRLRHDLEKRPLDLKEKCDEGIGNENEEEIVGEEVELQESTDEETLFENPEVIQIKKIFARNRYKQMEKSKKFGDALKSGGEGVIKTDIVEGKVIIPQMLIAYAYHPYDLRHNSLYEFFCTMKLI